MAKRRKSSRTLWLISLGLILLVPLILFLMDRPVICTCGTVKLWIGDVFSPEVSQHLSDWYVFSHIIHGFIFYYFARWLFPKKPVLFWAILAIAVEGAWEVLENTPFVIEYYRNNTMSTEFVGDTVINSTMDLLAMVAGFALAHRIPGWLTIALFIGMELMTTLLIRDGLILNVLMLLWPIDAIKEWQLEEAGGWGFLLLMGFLKRTPTPILTPNQRWMESVGNGQLAGGGRQKGNTSFLRRDRCVVPTLRFLAQF